MRIRGRAHEECRAHGVYGPGEDYKCIFYNREQYTYSVIYSVGIVKGRWYSQGEESTYRVYHIVYPPPHVSVNGRRHI
jgi:hypothetical protein